MARSSLGLSFALTRRSTSGTRLRALFCIASAFSLFAISCALAAQTRGLAAEEPTPFAGGANGTYYALVIGINDYSAPLSRLKTAVNDAQAMGNLLKDRYGFRVTYLLDRSATRFNILNTLSGLRNTLTENDNLLIYYAGHGYSDKDAEKAYWLPVDADSATSPNRIIADDLTTGVRVLPSRHVLIISDSCYSGALTRDADSPIRSGGQAAFIARMLRSRSRTLMASGGDEPVSDSGTNGHSVFAYAVLDALNRTDQSMFTASDLFYGSVRQEVAGRSEQLPQYSIIRNSDHDEGDFVFMRLPTHVAAAVPPPAPAVSAPVAAPIAADIPRIPETKLSTEETLHRGEALAKDRRYADAAPLLSSACEAGAMVGCTDLGWQYQNGLGLGRDYAVAVRLYRKACDGGQMRGCNNLAIVHENGWGVGKDESEASELYLKACDGGDPMACKNLGAMYEMGKGVGMNLFTALIYYRKSCDGGFGQGCTRLGLAFVNGAGTAKNFEEAFAAYTRACDAGDAMGCNSLGGLYMNGQGVAKDEARAGTLALKGCDSGSATACKNLGWMYSYGRGVVQDDVQSVNFYRKGCEGGDAASCSALGQAYENGKGVAKDDVQAVAQYRRACDGGDAPGCNSMGAMYHMGKGLKADDAQAASYTRKSCDAGYALGCSNLGFLYEKGWGVSKDATQAAELYHSACEGGVKDACNGLNRLKPADATTPKQAAPTAQAAQVPIQPKQVAPTLGPK